jgi:MFS family permease
MQVGVGGRGNKKLLSKITELSFVGFVMSIALAFMDTVWSIYIDSFVHNTVIVGFVTAFLALLSVLSFFLFIPLVEKTNKPKLFSFSILLVALTYLVFAIDKRFFIFIVFASILVVLGTLRATSFGIMVRDKSAKNRFSRNEGFLFTLANIAWILGPLAAGYLSSRYGVSMVFILAAVFMVIAFLLFKTFRIKDSNVKHKTDTDLIKNFFTFFKSRERRIAYFLGGGVHLWWAFIYVFMPLFIIRNGLNDVWVGYFLFAVAFPLVLFEYKFSKIVEKRGFKKMFKIGFLIVTILAFLCFFVGNVYIVLGLIALASVGMAMLEPTTDAYFFDILEGKEALRFYGPYNTTVDINNVIGRSLSAVVLIFFPFKFLFLFFALLMFLMFLLSSKTKKIIEDDL